MKDFTDKDLLDMGGGEQDFQGSLGLDCGALDHLRGDDTLKLIRVTWGIECERRPDATVDTFPFLAGKKPKLYQMAGLMWLLHQESSLVQEDSEVRQHLGVLIRHAMGMGKASLAIMIYLMNMLLVKVKEEIALSREDGGGASIAKHCAEDAAPDSVCPSGAHWRRTFMCPCQPGSPTRKWLGWAERGATIMTLPPHTITQFTREWVGFVDCDRIADLLGGATERPVLAVGYNLSLSTLSGLNSSDVRKLEDIGPAGAGRRERKHAPYDPLSPPWTLEDWRKANESEGWTGEEIRTRLLLLDVYKNELSEPPARPPRDNPARLMIVCTPGTIHERVVEGFCRNAIRPVKSRLLLPEEMAAKACPRHGNPALRCWLSSCVGKTPPKTHKTDVFKEEKSAPAK